MDRAGDRAGAVFGGVACDVVFDSASRQFFMKVGISVGADGQYYGIGGDDRLGAIGGGEVHYRFEPGGRCKRTARFVLSSRLSGRPVP